MLQSRHILVFIQIFWHLILLRSYSSYEIRNDKDAVAYLTQYGYVDPETMPLGFTLKDCNLKLKEFQRLAQVPITGELDNATLKAMNRPRCGSPDFMHKTFDERGRGHGHGHAKHAHQKHHHRHPSVIVNATFLQNQMMPYTYTASNLKWMKAKVTFSIIQYPTRYGTKVSQPEIEMAVQEAFKIWEEHINLEFIYLQNSVDVDIEVRFVPAYHGDNSPFDGPGNVLAHAYPPGTGLGGDVHFDEDENWTLGTYSGTDVLYVAVHEIGHSLGLGHSNVYGTIMYPMYLGYFPNLQLHADDIRGIQALYGRKSSPPKPSTVRPSYPKTTKPTTSKTTTTPSTPEDGDLCNLSPSGISGITKMLGDAILVFKGIYVYEIGNDSEGVKPGWPKRISQYFEGLEGNLDAVMTQTNGKTYFFKDGRYWRFTGTKMDQPSYGPGYPRKIREYFPGIPENIDAAFEWDGEFVFTKGMHFWRFNTRTNPKVQKFFPMHLNHWGLTKKLDAAFSANGTTYFFQGEYYWEFDENLHKIKNRREGPSHSGQKWFGCWEP